MENNNHVSNSEVKRYFLLANAGKRLFKPSENLHKICLEDKYKQIMDEIFRLKDHELNDRIKDKVRLARYDKFEWYAGKRKLDDIGPWPKMDSLDIRLTTGSIIETAEAIMDAQNGKILLHYSDEAEREKRTTAFKRFSDKSISVRENLDFVYERFPIILFPSGEVREKDYNKWARENNEPLCSIFSYDLDDGNTRAVSYAMAKIQAAPCFYALGKKQETLK